MKSPDEIVDLLAYRIGNLYHHGRPLMYGGTAAGVDLLLLTLHEIWAEVVDRHQEFDRTWRQVGEEQACGSANFSTRYKMNHPDASEEEIAAYTVTQWREVSDRIGVPIDHLRLAREFEEGRKPKS